jgi:hypothetical protein
MSKHKKEKIVDQYLIKEEKKYIKDLVKKVEHFEKIAEVKLGHKRHREEVAEQKVEEVANGKEFFIVEVAVGEAIKKILKHINKPDKLSKCLDLLKTIFLKLDSIDPLVIIKIFESIFDVPMKDATAMKSIEGK